MDFWRTLEILNKRKWLILLSVIVAVALTFFATRLVGSKWVATVRFAASERINLDSRNDAGRIPDIKVARQQAAMYMAMVLSRDVLQPALDKLNISEAPPQLVKNITFMAQSPRIYELQVTDGSPDRAQKLVNAIAQSFQEKNRKLYTEAADTQANLLKQQLDAADERLRVAQKRYDAERRKLSVHTTVNDQIQPAMSRLQVARQQRDDWLGRLAEAQARLNERRAELAATPKTIKNQRGSDANPLVQQLETQLADVEAKLEKELVTKTKDHIDVVRLYATRDALDKRLKAERSRPPMDLASAPNPAIAPIRADISRLNQEVRAAKARIAELDAVVNRASAEVDRFSGIDSQLNFMAQEMKQLLDTRSNIAARLQAANAAQDIAARQNPLRIMDLASQYNPPIDTSQGRTLKLIALAGFCTFVAVTGLVIALDVVDRRVRTVADAERVLPAPVLTAIPAPTPQLGTGSLARTAELAPQSLHSEAYRFLSLQLLNARGRNLRSLMVVSAKAEQGTTNTATNLAITLAQAGKQVIVVDANLRSPQMHSAFEMRNEIGLTDLLQNPDTATLESALRPTTVPNLRVITCGAPPANPWEMLRSPNLLEVSRRLRDIADYVIYDTPSALAFTDALNIAPAVDAAFLCVRALEAPTGAEQRLIALLEQANVIVLGSVLSDVPASVLDSYENYQHYYPTPPGGAGAATARAAEGGGAYVGTLARPATAVDDEPRPLDGGGPGPPSNGANGSHPQGNGKA